MQTSLKRIAICLATAGLILAPAAARAANPHNPMQGVAVGGTSADGNVFKGTMDVLGFVNDGGVVKAIANLSGTLTSAAGVGQQVTNAIVLMPVNTGATAGGLGGAAPTRAATAAATAASCQILHLDLGPLDLNLLGLAVHLDEVVLDITAVPGAGNLLGNLLCGVANLLNGFNLGNILGTALANTLTTLLNNILMAL